jgi:eukaryotic-like serine/threonine-protein kinase
MGLSELDESEQMDGAWELVRSKRVPITPPLAATEGDFYVAVGDVIAGKYRVEHVLGVGGMAFVLSAKHVELEQQFALKFLNKQFLREPAIIERFTREAKAACKLRSEHVACVYDVGTHEGAPFFVMEHLEGRDLATVLAEGGALGAGEAVEYAMQACEALAVAHSHGIVHRDIKPENLFLVEREGGLPTVKLLDFGISKVALGGRDSVSSLTGTLTLGTPSYMSPEQIRSTASADERSDLWSLGVVLYELLSGTPAFLAETVTEMCAAVLEQEPRPLVELRPDVPPELAAVVARCMQKEPSDRFADVAELAMALLPFAPARSVVSAERSSSLMKAARRTSSGEQRISSIRPATPTPTPRPSTSTSPPAPARSSASSMPPARRRGRGTVAVVALAIVGLAGAAALHQMRGAEVHPSRWTHAEPTEIGAAEDHPSVALPVSTRAMTRPDEPSAAEAGAAATPVARRAPTASAPPRRAAPSGPRPSATASPSSMPASSAAPTASAASTAVELGY